MTIIHYDNTYEGFLTAVFDIYELKFDEVSFLKAGQPNTYLFSIDVHHVITDATKASRVLKGLKNKLSADGIKRFYMTFLSETENAEENMLQFVKYVFSSERNVEGDLGNSAVWNIRKAARFVKRESHRMKAFVRFMLTKDQIYYAIIEPECDVLPLISTHFTTRYADQRWLIYDAARNYGLYYDLSTVAIVQLHFNGGTVIRNNTTAHVFDEREIFYQNLWKRYFNSVNIESRKNIKLHVQHMPKRYWKNLIEKLPED